MITRGQKLIKRKDFLLYVSRKSKKMIKTYIYCIKNQVNKALGITPARSLIAHLRLPDAATPVVNYKIGDNRKNMIIINYCRYNFIIVL